MPLDLVGRWYYHPAMKPETSMLSVRLPKDLIRALDQRATREKQTRSDVIKHLLAYGVRETPSAEGALGKILNQITALRHAVERLEKGRR